MPEKSVQIKSNYFHSEIPIPYQQPEYHDICCSKFKILLLYVSVRFYCMWWWRLLLCPAAVNSISSLPLCLILYFVYRFVRHKKDEIDRGALTVITGNETTQTRKSLIINTVESKIEGGTESEERKILIDSNNVDPKKVVM